MPTHVPHPTSQFPPVTSVPQIGANPRIPQAAATPPAAVQQTPGGPTETAPVPGPPPPGLFDEWKAFLETPEAKAALIQFGVTALSGGGIGQSLGDAGAAVGRLKQIAREERKTVVSERRAGAAEKSAEAASTAAGASVSRADTAKDELAERKRQFGETQKAAKSAVKRENDKELSSQFNEFLKRKNKLLEAQLENSFFNQDVDPVTVPTMQELLSEFNEVQKRLGLQGLKNIPRSTVKPSTAAGPQPVAAGAADAQVTRAAQMIIERDNEAEAVAAMRQAGFPEERIQQIQQEVVRLGTAKAQKAVNKRKRSSKQRKVGSKVTDTFVGS